MNYIVSKLAIVFLVITQSPINFPLAKENVQSNRLTPVIAQSSGLDVLYEQGVHQFEQQAYQDALSSFQAVLDLATQVGDRGYVALSLNQIALTYFTQGKYEQALNRYQLALEEWEELAVSHTDTDVVDDIRYNRAFTLTGIGRSLRKRGDYELARSRFDEALSIHTELGSRRGRAIVQSEIAGILITQGENEAALRILEEALESVRDIDAVGENHILNHIGVAYYSSGDEERALAYYEQALAVEHIDEASELTTLINIANVYNTQGNLQAAETLIEQILELRKPGPLQTVNPVLEAKLFGDIGSLYAAQGRYEEALESYTYALELYLQQGNSTGEALIRNNAANVFLAIKDHDQAKEFYLKALEIYEAANDLPGKGQVLADLGRFYERLEDQEGAKLYYQRAIDEVYESTLINIQSSRLKISFTSQHADVYSRLIELLWDSEDYELAFEYVERSRARAFLDQVANSAINLHADTDHRNLVEAQDIRTELLQKEEALSELLLLEDSSDQVLELRTEIAKLQQGYIETIERLKRQSPQAADFVSVNPASLQEIQDSLGPQDTLVEYFMLDDRILAFVVTPEALQRLPL